MEQTADTGTDWIGKLTFVCGAAVVIPSLLALAWALLAVVQEIL